MLYHRVYEEESFEVLLKPGFATVTANIEASVLPERLSGCPACGPCATLGLKEIIPVPLASAKVLLQRVDLPPAMLVESAQIGTAVPSSPFSSDCA